MWLTEAELRDLTGKVKPDAQARVLKELGIPFKRRPGKVIVFERDLTAQRRAQDRGQLGVVV